MGEIRQLLRHSLPAYFWRQAKSHYIQRHVLPKTIEAELEGVRLDISEMTRQMKEIILTGKYEQAETTLCRQIIVPGERILELGGAIGYVGLFCLRNLQAAEVISVEPNPRTAGTLRRNYELNHLQPHLVEVAISDRNGSLNLNISDEFWGDSAFAANGTPSPSQVQVECITIQSLLQKNKATHFTVLISDIEGAESLVNWSELPSTIKKIIIELHPRIVGYALAYKTLYNIMSLGFTVEARINDVIALRR